MLCDVMWCYVMLCVRIDKKCIQQYKSKWNCNCIPQWEKGWGAICLHSKYLRDMVLQSRSTGVCNLWKQNYWHWLYKYIWYCIVKHVLAQHVFKYLMFAVILREFDWLQPWLRTIFQYPLLNVLYQVYILLQSSSYRTMNKAVS